MDNSAIDKALSKNSLNGYGSVSRLNDIEEAQDQNHNGQINLVQAQEFKGLIFMLLSALGFSLNGLVVKLSGTYFSASKIVLARSLIQASCGIFFCFVLGYHPLGPAQHRKLLALRGMFGGVGLALFYYSLTVLPIADATVLFFTSPVFTSLLAHLALGEPYSGFDAGASVLCLIGVILCARPQFLFGSSHILLVYFPLLFEAPPASGFQQTIGAFSAVAGAALSACAYVTVRKLGRSVHFLTHVVSFGLVSTLFSGVMVLTDYSDRVLPTLGFNYPTLLLVLVGITAVLGQCLLNQGLQLCRAGPATLMRNVDVVFAYIYGILVFNELPSLFSLAGSALIVSCTIGMGLKKWLS